MFLDQSSGSGSGCVPHSGQRFSFYPPFCLPRSTFLDRSDRTLLSLLGLAMSSMHATGSTELSQFKAIRIVLLVLRGRIIPLLANRASQCSDNAILFTFTGHAFSPFEFRKSVWISSFDYIIP